MHKFYDPILKEWTGPATHQPLNPSAPLAELLLYCFDQRPNKVAHFYPDEEKQVTYGELKQISIRVAENLRKLGLKPGDIVSVVCTNNSKLAAIVFGCALSGVLYNLVTVTYEKGK